MEKKTAIPQPTPPATPTTPQAPSPSLQRDAREQAYMMMLTLAPTDVMH